MANPLPRRVCDWDEEQPRRSVLTIWLSHQVEPGEVLRLLERADLWLIRQAPVIATHTGCLNREIVQRLLRFPDTAVPLARHGELCQDGATLIAESVVQALSTGDAPEESLQALAELERAGFTVPGRLVADLEEIANRYSFGSVEDAVTHSAGALLALREIPSSLDTDTLLEIHGADHAPDVRRWAASALLTAQGRDSATRVRVAFRQLANETPDQALTLLQDAGGLTGAPVLSREDLVPLLQGPSSSARLATLLLMEDSRGNVGPTSSGRRESCPGAKPARLKSV